MSLAIPATLRLRASAPVPTASYTLDFNAYTANAGTFNGATIVRPDQNVFNTSDPNNKYLEIYYSGITTASSGCIVAPSQQVRTIEMWVRLNSPFNSLGYLLDARTGLGSGYIYNSAGTAGYGPDWVGGKYYQNADGGRAITDVSPDWYTETLNGGWKQIVLVCPTAFTDDITFFARYGLTETTPFQVGLIRMYDKVLTSTEVTSLYNQDRVRFGLSAPPPPPSPVGIYDSLVLWLDETSYSTDIWTDKSAKGNTATKFSGTIGTTTINGKQAVSFGNAVMKLTDRQLFAGSPGTTLFIVFTASNGYGHPMGAWVGANNHICTGGSLLDGIGSSYRVGYGSIFSTSTPSLYTNHANFGGNTLISKNGSVVGTVGYGSAYRDALTHVNNNYSLGSAMMPDGNSALTSWTGSIGEMIAYNKALTVDEKQKIEGYLAWKWGLISSLPTDHLYKTIAPA